MEKKNKILLIAASVIMIVIALVIIFTREVPSTNSASFDKDFVAKTVGTIRFNDIKIVNNQVTALVQNVGVSDYEFATVNVIVKDASNNTIDELYAYVGETIEPNEIKLLSTKSDRDLSNAKSVDFSFNSYFKKTIRVHSNCEEFGDFTIVKELNNTLGRFDIPTREGYLVKKLYSDSNMTDAIGINGK